MRRNQNITSSFILIYKHPEEISRVLTIVSSPPSPKRSKCYLDFDGDWNILSLGLVLCAWFAFVLSYSVDFVLFHVFFYAFSGLFVDHVNGMSSFPNRIKFKIKIIIKILTWSSLSSTSSAKLPCRLCPTQPVPDNLIILTGKTLKTYVYVTLKQWCTVTSKLFVNIILIILVVITLIHMLLAKLGWI